MTQQCLHCGKCLMACPLSHTSLKPFLLAREERDYAERLWNCTNCKMCQEVCPQKIDLWSLKMKDRLLTEPPHALQNNIALLHTIGFALPISEEVNQEREDNKLSPITFLSPEAISKLLE